MRELRTSFDLKFQNSEIQALYWRLSFDLNPAHDARHISCTVLTSENSRQA